MLSAVRVVRGIVRCLIKLNTGRCMMREFEVV